MSFMTDRNMTLDVGCLLMLRWLEVGFLDGNWKGADVVRHIFCNVLYINLNAIDKQKDFHSKN